MWQLSCLGPTVDAWRSGGCRWKAWSSRMVSVVGSAGVVHVVSCYAPTLMQAEKRRTNVTAGCRK